VAILIDEPRWPAHGRLWAHLVSDSTLDELHEFAARAGIPARGFDHDHYDVPAERWDALVALGAHPVGVREFVERLERSGLRVKQRDKG
jgi:Mn-dependent DtxR family transcriptional regulator